MIQTQLTEAEIFKVAREIAAPHARAAYLQQACGDDAALRERVIALLRIAEEEQSFLEHPAAALAPTILPAAISEKPGDVIGPYKLMEQIGEGGFGLVFVAEQHQPVRRKVALKVIKPGMDTREVVARFEAERQALAMMDHPHIATVLDAGTTDSGRPYFVMELVRGVPITEYCDANHLTPRERLQLFISVCQAVQHAHQKGVIHRDLKPGNILVAPHDGIPMVKVIDFGVAKALGQQLTERTVYTRFAQMIGTPLYMSPEQAEINALDVDTRSDVYALGVLLYELLTGTTPFDRTRLHKAAFDEIRRIIREEEPLRPSTRISTLGLTLPDISAKRKTDPGRLSAEVRGELDWIVMKCLEKDRTRRYDTANGLARDIQHYLADEPVEACPPSAAYRLKKFTRKHRGLLTTAAAFATLLVVGVVASTWLAAWAVRSQHSARYAQLQAEAALDGERVARQEAEAARTKAEWFSKRLSVATQIANEGADYYYRNNRAAALERFAKAAAIEPDLNTIYFYRKMVYTELGLWELAEADYDQLFRLASRAHPQTCYEHALLEWYTGNQEGYQGACQEILRQYGSSANRNDQRHVLRACLLAPELVGDPADFARRAEEMAANDPAPWNSYTAGVAHLRAGNLEQAIARLREALATGGRSPGGVHRLNYLPLATALHRAGQTPEAQAALAQGEQAIDGWISAMLNGPVGLLPLDWWDWLECRLLYREAKILITGAPPADDPRLQKIHERALAAITYGDAFTSMEATRGHVAQHQWEQAAASFLTALDQLPNEITFWSPARPLCEEIARQPEVFARLIELRPRDARLWFARGHNFVREREWVKANADLSRTMDFGKWDRSVIAMMIELAAVSLLAGDESAYTAYCEKVVRDYGQSDDPFAASAAARVCTLSPKGAADWSIPIRCADTAIQSAPRVPWYVYSAGAAHYRAGQNEEAVQFLKRSLESHPRWKGRGQNYVMLALACQKLGRLDEARSWLTQTRNWLDEMRQTLGKEDFDVSASPYVTDWLSGEVLFREAEALLANGGNR